MKRSAWEKLERWNKPMLNNNTSQSWLSQQVERRLWSSLSLASPTEFFTRVLKIVSECLIKIINPLYLFHVIFMTIPLLFIIKKLVTVHYRVTKLLISKFQVYCVPTPTPSPGLLPSTNVQFPCLPTHTQPASRVVSPYTLS